MVFLFCLQSFKTAEKTDQFKVTQSLTDADHIHTTEKNKL